MLPKIMLTSTDDDMKAPRQQQHATSSSLSTAATANQEKTFFSSAAESSQPQLLQQNRLGDTTDIANSLSIAKRKQSMVEGAPDVGILSKDFLKNKGQEEQSIIEKKFAIHRKKRAAAVDVDVGILSNGRRRQASRVNQHAMNELKGRSLQSEEVLPDMCPGEYGYGGWSHIDGLFNKVDSYFPKCSCPSPTTCGPVLCECLEYADGDILQCMDSFNQLCEGTMNIDGIPGPWSMEKCLGSKSRAIEYCSMLPCYVDGGSYWQCACERGERSCTEYRDTYYCAISKCCQAQTDDEGREACYNEGYENYYDQVTSFSISYEEMTSRFNECSFNSDSDKSIVQCYCESFSYGECVNNGVARPDLCEAMNCCFGETEDDARLDCFSRFRDGWAGIEFYNHRDAIQESCVASGKSGDQCKCDIEGLSNCVGEGNGNFDSDREPRCDLFQCCQSQTGDNDDGRKDCLVQDEAQLMYERCIIDGNTTEACVCEKSNTLCSSGHSNDLHCELSSCCQNQTDDTGRKECIGNFTTSQPSSAPSETPAKDSIDEAGASSTAASAPPSTSGVSISTHFDAKSLTKTRMLAAATVVGWLIFT